MQGGKCEEWLKIHFKQDTKWSILQNCCIFHNYSQTPLIWTLKGPLLESVHITEVSISTGPVIKVKNTLFYRNTTASHLTSLNITKKALIQQTVSMKTHGSLEKIDQKLCNSYQLDWCQNGLLLLCTIHSFWCTRVLILHHTNNLFV